MNADDLELFNACMGLCDLARQSAEHLDYRVEFRIERQQASASYYRAAVLLRDTSNEFTNESVKTT